jgi:predicted tellurium resistance membrane protein TerC
MSLVADGLHHHVPKGYLYFAMGFAVGVEALNLRLRAKHGKPVKLREPYVAEPERFGGPFDAAGR